MGFFINVVKGDSAERFEVDAPLMGHEVLTKFGGTSSGRVMAWRVNRILRPLGWFLDDDADVEFVDTSTVEGMEIYRRTLTFILSIASKKVTGKDIFVRHSMSDSYYCEFLGAEATAEQVDAIREEMRRLTAANLPIQMAILSLDKARRIFERQGNGERANLLQWTGVDPVALYRCAGIYGFFGDPLASSSEAVATFGLTHYAPGFLLRFPSITDTQNVQPIEIVPKLMGIFREYSNWLGVLGLRTMDSLHERVANGQSLELILISEAFHSEALSKIAREVIERKGTRIVCLAGPSSSGKTTTSKRLATQLQIYGKNPIAIALDNYYVDRDRTPRDENGNYDFEALEALEVDLVNEHLNALLAGETVQLPKYDFVTGKRKEGPTLRLGESDILIIEGIHGLNDALTRDISHERKYKLFISPLTSVNLDTYNRIGTTDVRLIRRMVRDHRTRGYSPERTLLMWPSVIKGSLKYIFPYEEATDALFNTSLVYEMSVLKGYAEPMLRAIPECSPAYGEARRLLSMLSFVPAIPSENVPNLSILREFIGGSCFDD